MEAGLAGRDLLDIGCGDGALGYMLAKDGWRVRGLDYSGTGLGFAAEMFAARDIPAMFVRGDSCSLPIKDGSMDAVVAADIIEHLHEPGRLLLESYRVLRPGGAAVITTPVKLSETPADREHVREFTEAEFRAALLEIFSEVELVLSHPAKYAARSNRTYRFFGLFGRLRPYKYLYNFMSSSVGRNPFLGPDDGSGFTQMTAICRKK